MARCLIRVIGLMLLLWASPGIAQQDNTTLNFENVDIRQFINTISVQTTKTFVIDPRLAGKVTIIAPPEATLTEGEVWDVFLATMQVNGYSVVPITQNEYKIIPSEIATRQPGVAPGQAASGEIVTRIVSLNFVDARSAEKYLQGIAGERSQVIGVPETNNLIIVDTAGNVSRMLEALDNLDRDRTDMRTVTLQNAVASDVATVLRDLVSQGIGEGGRVNATSIVAVDSSNTLILRGNGRTLDRLMKVVRDLDQAGVSDVDLTVVYLNHADAEELVPLLTEMIEKSYPAEGSTERRPSIVAHTQTNALIINADPETQRVIGSVVRQLDIRRPQVLIEAIIVEVSDNMARDIGLQYVLGGEDSGAISQSFGNTQPNLLAGIGAALLLENDQGGTTVTTVGPDGTVTTTTTDGTPIAGTDALVDAAIGSLLGLDGFAIGGGGINDDGQLFAAILTALERDTQSNILSKPFTITLDNQPSLLQVGQEIPVTVGETVGNDLNNAFRQIERQEVGTILEVTPQITEGNSIRMAIKQEVSSINGALTNLNSEFVTNKAVLETTFEAEDGEIFVIGGLLESNEQVTENKVPFLGDIPVAGNLFKGSSRSQRRGTLMVFIKPTIIRDKARGAAVTARKYDYARQQQMLKSFNEQPEIDALINDYLDLQPGELPAPNY